MLLKTPVSYNIHQNRRKLLKQKLGEFKKGEVILLFATFEESRHIFKQESSFYYFTGISEPGTVLALYPDGTEIVYLPNFGTERAKWVKVQLTASEHDGGKCAQEIGVTSINYLGKQKPGYAISPVYDAEQYEFLLNELRSMAQGTIHTLHAPKSDLYTIPYNRLTYLLTSLGNHSLQVKDIAAIVHEMRRTKDGEEIKLLQQAIDITTDAQKRAAKMLKHGMKEYQVRAEIERTFIYDGAFGPSFPSIVATGKNTTVLHYTELDQTLQQGDLVVVDIGALYGYYAADLTRTYPVGGKYTPRQKEVYNMVLDTQSYAASIAKPGMFLRNVEQPEKSLHHLAVEFLKKKGYEKYFVHGLGHFLGMDVHDVGDVRIPLREGDVFTIEPGIYIPDENLGVRIEDDYIITANGCRCLSEALPKRVDDVERMMTSG